MSFIERLGKIVTFDMSVFAYLREHPVWLTALLVVTLVNAGAGFLFFGSELGQEIVIEAMMERSAQAKTGDTP